MNEDRVREIVREELAAIASSKRTPSAAPPCLNCEKLSKVVLGTNFRGWTATNKQGIQKRRVFCRDCLHGWVVENPKSV